MLNVFDNHPVVELTVGSILLVGSLIGCWFAGSWIGESTVKMLMK